MTNQQQLEFILEQCRKMREQNQPDLMELWRRQQEEWRRAIEGDKKPDTWNLYTIGSKPNKNGHNLYTY